VLAAMALPIAGLPASRRKSPLERFANLGSTFTLFDMEHDEHENWVAWRLFQPMLLRTTLPEPAPEPCLTA
jgi:hypothetical protein